MFAIIILPNVQAQKKLGKEGVIHYKVTEVKSDIPGLEIMKGSTQNISFSTQKHQMDMSMMGGIVETQTITDVSSGTSTILMNLMGKKIQLELTKEEVKQKMDEKTAFTFTYYKKDKKKIAGYKCRKVIGKSKEGIEVILYVSKKITPKQTYFSELYPGLKGFPLEFTLSTSTEMGAFQMTYQAEEVVRTLAENSFSIPEGYEKMTSKEFQEQVGDMAKGLNLGF